MATDKTRPVSFRVEAQTHDALMALAKVSGMSAGQLLNQMLKDYLPSAQQITVMLQEFQRLDTEAREAALGKLADTFREADVVQAEAEALLKTLRRNILQSQDKEEN